MATEVTSTEILADVIAALRVQNPFLFGIAHEFTSQRLKRGQKSVAHIAKLPTASDHDDAKGYGENSQNAKDLYEDIPLTIDKHTDVALNIAYLNTIADNKQLYQEQIGNAAHVLGKEITLYVLGKAVAANLSQSTSEDAVNYDIETLGKVRVGMNKKGAPTMRRIGIVNSEAFLSLDSDPRIASSDYHGKQIEGEPMGSLMNVAGFKQVFEFPDLPDNGEGLNGLFLDSNAIALKTGLPHDIEAIAKSLGIPEVVGFETVTDPESKLTFLCLKYMDQKTLDVHMILTITYGCVVGKQGGADGDKTDYFGHRVVEAP